jgi:phosphopantetheinyl transferase
MIILEIPERWRNRSLVIEQEEIEYSDDSMFLAAELHLRDAMALPKRRREWTASRKALKLLAVGRGVIAEPLDALIESDDASRPRFSNIRTGGTWHVSLSHSRGLAAAAIDRQPIGIDVERVRPLSFSAAHLFLTDSERGEIESARIEHALLHGWCAKEAAWKALSLTHETLKSVPLRMTGVSGRGLTFIGTGLAVETQILGEDVVAAIAITL